uniref:BACK domain-containing protein n=1 Tax=Panagrellus redivivus TaxID=6233 RepID=A0A7E4W998_PANRE
MTSNAEHLVNQFTDAVKFESTDDALEILRLASMYKLSKLQNLAVYFLTDNCTVDNVCSILNEGVLLSLNSLTDFAIKFMNNKPCEVLKHQSFEQLSKDALNAVLSRVAFPVSDIKIIHAVVGWKKANPSKHFDLAEILENVVLHSVSSEDMAALPPDVRDAVVHLIHENLTSGPIYLFNKDNVAMPKFEVEGFFDDVMSFFEDRAEVTQKDVYGSTEFEDHITDLGYRIVSSLLYLYLFILMVNFFTGTSLQIPASKGNILEYNLGLAK